MKKIISFLLYFIGYSSLAVILFYAGVYFAVRCGWTDVEGSIDQNSNIYNQMAATLADMKGASRISDDVILDSGQIQNKDLQLEADELCKNRVISQFSSQNAITITNNYQTSKSIELLTKMVLAASLRLNNDPKFVESSAKCDNPSNSGIVAGASTSLTVNQSSQLFPWASDEEWATIKNAVKKDQPIIKKAAAESGIDPRMLATPLVVEQLRLFHTEREYYEKFFKPFQILGSANKMAWGVMNIKEKTAIQIESNLKDKNSAYYLGSKYENLLDFQSDNINDERYNRLANEKDHYYSYLYAGLYLNQYDSQWKKSGFLIGDRPEILATLYNLGFDHSNPKANPEVGGSDIEINGTKYTFGSLAYEFYYSGEMTDLFPYSSK
ncbi:MAG: hypothetical protein NTW50_01165 [Candidatus Berkelbacteria bacterium]|nr:hypothetical protein [Candidatus Berkelbacteria bacterium]